MPWPKHGSFWSLFLYFVFFSTSRKVWTSLSVSDTKYSVLLVAIIQENFDKQPWTENSEGPARVTQKASDVSSADWRYQTHEKLLYITFVLLQPFSGLGFLVKHDSLYNKYIINHYVWINYPLLLINWHFTQRYNLSPLDRMPVHRKVTPPPLI